MTSYGYRLATFTSSIPWPHAPPTPQPKDLAAAGFKHTPNKIDPDSVKCSECSLELSGWEPHDNALTEHAKRSPQCPSPYSSLIKSLRPPTRILRQVDQKFTAKEPPQISQKSTIPEHQAQEVPTSKDIGFFDPSLQYDFPELRLYHDVNVFVNQVPCDQYRGTDIVQLLPKCLRDAAYMWYQSNQETLKDIDLTKCMEALVAKFKKQPQKTPNSVTQQQTPQLPVEYHKCTICSASFSSISRLLSHSQMVTCGKSSCKHCEEIFDSKNKLHDHVRNKECQQSLTKSKLANKTGLMPLSTSETIFSDADTAIKKGGTKPNTRPVEHRFGSLSPRSRQVGTVPGTQGALQGGLTTYLQGISQPGLDTRMRLTGIAAIIHLPIQTFRVTSWPGLQQARNLEQNRRPRVLPQTAADLLILLQPPYSHKVLGSFLTDASSQRADRNDGYGHYRGRARTRDSSVARTSYTHLQTGTRSTSKSSGVELDIIDSYGFSSEEPETRASTRTTSRASQYGCALANEEDYVAEGLSDVEDDVWDECEMSPGEE
ncbi:MAG: Baculoviral IAP repeat containing [Alectoria sarmentosa]|nr:MAG: Baculoviral IAP repeat containing [Alectoria sarmentosa]